MTTRAVLWTALLALALLAVAAVLVWMGLNGGAEELAPRRFRAYSDLA